MLKDQDFVIPSGDCKKVIFSISGITGDLTTGSARWSASRRVTTDALIAKSSADATEITLTSDTVVMQLAPEDTSELRPSNYYHELEITLDGCVFTAAIGTMTVLPTLMKPS